MRDEILNQTLLFVLGCHDNQGRDGQGTILHRAISFFPCAALLAYDSLERNETCTVVQLEEDNDPVAVKRRSPTLLTNKTKRVLFSTEWVHHSGSGGEDRWPINFVIFLAVLRFVDTA